jgi:CheY-like chemotaxis protein
MEEERPSARTLLVVEDNIVIREGLAVILRRQGFTVALAANGQVALNLLGEGQAPALILLDMLMPVLDGWRFLEMLRRQGPVAPVILITAGAISREWALDHGCGGFVGKPVEPEELLEEIRRCLPD